MGLGTGLLGGRRGWAGRPGTALRAIGLAVLVLLALAPPPARAQVAFTPSASLAAAGPGAVALGDLDRDGRLDVVVASVTTAAVRVFLGNGDGTFTTGATLVTDGPPRSVAVGDLDGDGTLDVVTANPAAGTVSIFRGNGDGTFGPRSAVGVGAGPIAVALVDWDLDGRLDAVVVHEADADVTILLNDGSGGLLVRDSEILGAVPRGLAVGDVDRDGRPDVVIAHPNVDAVSVLLNDGAGGLDPPLPALPTGTQPVAVALGDVDGDGTLDLVVVSQGASSVSVHLGVGDGTFGPPADFAAGTAPAAVALGDVNGDGKLDLVVGGSLVVLLGRGDGSFGFPTGFPVSGAPAAVALGDLSRDGRLDLVVVSPGSNLVSVFRNATPRPAASFAAAVQFATGNGPLAVAVGDLDRDGKPDVITANGPGASLSVLLGDGAGGVGAPAGVSLGGASQGGLIVADFNRDGKLDVAATAFVSGDRVLALLGDGLGGLAPAGAFAAGLGVRGVAAGDFSGDGILDLVTANATAGTVSTLTGNGDGTFAPIVGIPVGAGPRAVALGDLDRNGMVDGVTANELDSTVSVILNLRTFALVSSFPTGAGPVAVAVGDVNRDGKPDVVTANGGGASVSVLLGDGAGGLGPKTDLAVGQNPVHLVLVDVDGDGALDILTANSGGTVSLLRGNGSGGFGSRADFPVGAGPTGLAVADVDRDGLMDVVTANRQANTISVLRGIRAPATLTVTRAGAGSGTVTGVPAGIDCGVTCVATFPGGTVVTLVATPAAGSTLAGFDGAADCIDGVVRMTAALACTVTFGTAPPPGALGVTSLLSAGIGGTPSDGGSRNPSFSADGTIVAIQSTATNLTGACTSGVAQIYVVNRTTGQATCVTVSATGAPGNGASVLPVLSADGSVLVFETTATNLVPGCVTTVSQVLLFNLATGARTCLSAAADGTPGNGASGAPDMTADGAVIAFRSAATNVAPGCTSGIAQILVVNRVTGARMCASAGPGGVGNGASDAPAISGDGRVLAFESRATNLAGPCTGPRLFVFVVDLETGAVTCASVGPGNAAANADSRAPTLSADGVRLAFASAAANLAPPCTSGVSQIFVLNRATGELRCLTVNQSGQPGNLASEDPAFSGNGLVVVFATSATNLGAPVAAAAARVPGVARQLGNVSSIVMNDLVQGLFTQLTTGTGSATRPQVTTDGSRVGFSSTAADETDDDPDGGTDVFVVDLGATVAADRVTILAPANGIQLPLTQPTPLTFRWTALALPGVTQYGLEFTGPNLAFANPNGNGADPVNGFGGAGGAFVTGSTRRDVVVPTGLPPGNRQVRVIGLNAAFQTVGVFSDAITVILGVVAIPLDARPTITGPASGATVVRGTTATFTWSVIPGVAQYLFEFTSPGATFSNPNGVAPDPTALGSVVALGTSLIALVPPTLAPGPYQIRIIALNAAGQPVGTFSDAVTVNVQ
jgi:Tol biopolymer transport system component